MKILIPGTPRTPTPTWWEGRKADCSVCGAVTLFEKGDPVVVETTNGDRAFSRCCTERCPGLLHLTRQEALLQAEHEALNEGKGFINKSV